jgi:hypothetical protein
MNAVVTNGVHSPPVTRFEAFCRAHQPVCEHGSVSLKISRQDRLPITVKYSG